MDQWQGKVAVVTGASAGIGAAIAIDLVKSGMIVVGLARRQEKIIELKQYLADGKADRLHARKCDVTDDENVKAAFEWIRANVGIPHVLVNNAGLLREDYLLDLKNNSKSIRETIDINVMGSAICTRYAFDLMRENNVEGHIIMMNSISGHQVPTLVGTPVPTCSLYAPSKFAITAMTDVIRQELEIFKSNIKITSISPGFVKSDMTGGAILKELLKVVPYLDPEDVSAAVVYVLGTPPHVEVQELTIKGNRRRK